jgi:hypothetical protein
MQSGLNSVWNAAAAPAPESEAVPAS